MGNAAALEVEITDNSFNPDHFAHVSGELNARIDRVPPYANVSHTVVVRPRKYGYFNFTSAEVLYRSKEDAPRLQFAVSSEPGEAIIVSFRDYDKQFSSHVVSGRDILYYTYASINTITNEILNINILTSGRLGCVCCDDVTFVSYSFRIMVFE